MISVETQSKLDEFSKALAEYFTVSGKSAATVLDQKANFISNSLYRRFFALQPRAGQVTQDAKDRGWRMGRKQDAIRGISKTAWKQAESTLAGKNSVLINESGSVVLAGKLGGMVLHKRKNAHYARADEVYKIFGRTFRQRALPSLFSRAAYAKMLNLKIIGRRALAVKLEAGLREKGHGFTGVSWLFKRWKVLAASDPTRTSTNWRILQNMNPKSRIEVLGEMQLGKGDGEHGAFLRITSFAPGVATARGEEIIRQALDDEMEGMSTYVLQKQVAAFKQIFRAFKNQTN